MVSWFSCWEGGGVGERPLGGIEDDEDADVTVVVVVLDEEWSCKGGDVGDLVFGIAELRKVWVIFGMELEDDSEVCLDALVVGEIEVLVVGELEALVVGEMEALVVGEMEALVVGEMEALVVGEMEGLVGVDKFCFEGLLDKFCFEGLDDI